MIRSATKIDAQQICNIYNYYVKETAITFEESIISPSEMEKRIIEATESLPWLVYVDNDEIAGYAHATKWKGRCAYRFSVESTIYLDNNVTGKGIGILLYSRLLDELRNSKLHSVLAGISLPNEKSISLHEKFGFKKAAHLSEVGYKFGKWIDVGYWQLLFDTK